MTGNLIIEPAGNDEDYMDEAMLQANQ
uniref:Uncharacterized protein n=1 Tax=Romanomermis culicivorax TaxID=13658 RepID=A0A915HVI2_ROMCU